MNRIALFLPNWIGDVVMATPAVRAVRRAFPAADLLAVASRTSPTWSPGRRGSATSSPSTSAAPRQRLLAVAGRLRRERIDAAVLFPNSFRPALAARLGGLRTVVGFVRYGRRFLLTHRAHPVRDAAGRLTPSPMLDDYNRLAGLLGTPDPGRRMELFTTPADEAAADAAWAKFRLGRYSRVVALNPGAAFGAAKHWPAESFAQLARMLTQRLQAGVLVLCGPGERDMARRIADAARSPNVFSLADNALSLGLTKAVVRRRGAAGAPPTAARGTSPPPSPGRWSPCSARRTSVGRRRITTGRFTCRSRCRAARASCASARSTTGA